MHWRLGHNNGIPKFGAFRRFLRGERAGIALGVCNT